MICDEKVRFNETPTEYGSMLCWIDVHISFLAIRSSIEWNMVHDCKIVVLLEKAEDLNPRYIVNDYFACPISIAPVESLLIDSHKRAKRSTVTRHTHLLLVHKIDEGPSNLLLDFLLWNKNIPSPFWLKNQAAQEGHQKIMEI